jgi:SAM-dependent methyltransferase
VDVVVSGQTFEHIDFFWMSAFEIGRVLKPGGIAAIIAPSSGAEHRYPLDCWRYYPDGLAALARYVGFTVLEVGTDWRAAPWADSMLVMQKPLWAERERYRFNLALAHQRAVTSPIGFKEPAIESSLPLPSVLRGLDGGRLANIFTAASSQVVVSSPGSTLGALAARFRLRLSNRLFP